jgi:triphosphoribosyl-dephospho-CoA synthase
MALGPDAIAAAYREACLAELQALKPGNVHVYADGHRMTIADFAASAEASADAIARTGARIGTRVRAAVDATLARVGCNTNLGIVLLCAPLAAAAERPGRFAADLASVLAGLDRHDAADVFAAIRGARPAGLGHAPRHDVTAPPSGTLLEAMAEAADRDRIARAYTTGFDDLFAIGLPALAAARAAGQAESWCASAVYLAYLARFADTHIARKHGPERAEAVRRRAEELVRAIAGRREPVEPLIAFDAALKAEGLNPGTSADFTVATLFTDRLQRLRESSGSLVATERRE